MPLITDIPKVYHGGFRNMSSLSEEEFAELSKAIENIPAVSSFEKLSERIANIVKLDLTFLRDMLYSVGSLLYILEKSDKVEEIVEDVTNAAIESEIINIEVSEVFKQRLRFLVTNNNMYYVAKSAGLHSENSKTYLDAKIITDFRPIFGKNIEEKITAGVIVHNLHLHYRSDMDDNHKDFYISLDSNDIDELRSLLDRAEKKEKALQEVLNNSGITNLFK